MTSRRHIGPVLIGALLSGTIVVVPLRVSLDGWMTKVSIQSAWAKDGKGGGNGGRGNGTGGGKGNGNASGKSNGHGSGSGKSTGGKSKSGAQVSGRPPAAPGQHYNPKTGDTLQINGNTIEVLHRNGMREKISGGSYEMKDSKGRTIINRPATGADLARLRDMLS